MKYEKDHVGWMDGDPQLPLSQLVARILMIIGGAHVLSWIF